MEFKISGSDNNLMFYYEYLKYNIDECSRAEQYNEKMSSTNFGIRLIAY